MNQDCKQILLPKKAAKVFLAVINNEKLLVVNTLFNTQKYFKLPNLSFQKKHGALVLSLLQNQSATSIQQMYSVRFLERWLKELSKPVRKQLLLKGLGFRGALSADKRFLELKLGFSHLIKIPVDLKELKVSMTNTLLQVEGVEFSTVGNFLKKIRNLKVPDSYKGKGFWYKNESKGLKEIKKT
jgi:ribosomal protein L6P/L9E